MKKYIIAIVIVLLTVTLLILPKLYERWAIADCTKSARDYVNESMGILSGLYSTASDQQKQYDLAFQICMGQKGYER
ncbi:MAG: hypothetical protein AAB415_00540 [Patescibacteria group bacterium]